YPLDTRGLRCSRQDCTVKNLSDQATGSPVQAQALRGSVEKNFRPPRWPKRFGMTSYEERHKKKHVARRRRTESRSGGPSKMLLRLLRRRLAHHGRVGEDATDQLAFRYAGHGVGAADGVVVKIHPL